MSTTANPILAVRIKNGVVAVLMITFFSAAWGLVSACALANPFSIMTMVLVVAVTAAFVFAAALLSETLLAEGITM